MKYENAQNILPCELIELIQQYVDGKYLYIPLKEENTKQWGENSGAKEELKIRNTEIYEHYVAGTSIEELENAYYLSRSSIRRIIREIKKNNES